jgi:penicillin-binding protein-related factor A (putative recombinase)
MRESDFQSLFTKWAKKNFDRSAAFELKICKTKSMPFSRVEEHQLVALHKAKHYTLFHKISDMSLGYKPFDCFMLSEAEALIVIMFYRPGHRQYCYLIDIDAWSKFTVKSKRKSITEAQAVKIGTVIDLTQDRP